jgi:hypothetical protein
MRDLLRRRAALTHLANRAAHNAQVLTESIDQRAAFRFGFGSNPRFRPKAHDLVFSHRLNLLGRFRRRLLPPKRSKTLASSLRALTNDLLAIATWEFCVPPRTALQETGRGGQNLASGVSGWRSAGHQQNGREPANRAVYPLVNLNVVYLLR